jgi:hypothetical protein
MVGVFTLEVGRGLLSKGFGFGFSVILEIPENDSS